MTREDLIGKNAEIVAQVGAGIRDTHLIQLSLSLQIHWI